MWSLKKLVFHVRRYFWLVDLSILRPFLSKGYKDGLQPETLADGNWLVKQNQPVSKIETIFDKLEESVWVLIQECIDLKISDTVMTSQERNKFRAWSDDKPRKE